MTDDIAISAEVLFELVNKLSEDFDRECNERHAMGQEKYGPAKFLEIDSIRAAIEEVVDMSNYARYNYIKLRLIEMYVAKELGGNELKLGFDKAREEFRKDGFKKS